MQFTIVLISLAAGLVGAVGFTNNPFIHVQRDLERRAVPPCPKCPVSDQDWRSKYKQPQHTEMEASTAATNDKWLPLACSRHGYTCVEVEEGIDYRAGGFMGYPLGRWKRPDGSQVFVSEYWQSTIQFTGPGVTFNIYPAHCTVYMLAVGESSEIKVGGKVIQQGPGESCQGSASNIDIGLISFGYRKTYE